MNYQRWLIVLACTIVIEIWASFVSAGDPDLFYTTVLAKMKATKSRTFPPTGIMGSISLGSSWRRCAVVVGSCASTEKSPSLKPRATH